MDAQQVKDAKEANAGRAGGAFGAALLDVGQVAAILSCSKRSVYRLSDADKMPRPVRLGSLVRWNRESIEKWVSDGCPSQRRSKGGGG